MSAKLARRYLVLDYETRSQARIKSVGGYEYSLHPSTRFLCVAWRYGTKQEIRAQLEARVPAKSWSPAIPGAHGEFIRALCDPGVTLVAHNAMFEQNITRHVLSKLIHRAELKEIPVSRWLCTASLSRALALPAALEMVGEVLKLPIQKDKEGHRLMLKMSKPRKPSKANPSLWHQSKADLLRLIEYCKTDVDAESYLLLTLKPLIPFERKTWELDQKINLRGFHVNRPLVHSVLKMIGEEITNLDRETETITGGALSTTRKVARVLAWLKEHDVFFPDFKAQTVVDALREGIVAGVPRRVLEIRQGVSKTSNKKYSGFDLRSASDGRVRDAFIYHQAGPGRWAGSGTQPQNFPKGTMKVTPTMLEVLARGDLELVRMLFGDPLSVFSSCLRAMIQAPPGKKLCAGDWNAIEARVLFWMAGHEDGVAAFRDNRPMYEEMAAEIYDVPQAAIKNPSLERDMGKRAILGAGFQMGPPRFKDQCAEFGIIIPEELAEKAIEAYRRKHRPVVKMWSNIERAALGAVKNPGRSYRVNKTKWWVEGKFLFCELPSGRRNSYYSPEIRQRKMPWGEMKEGLFHWGLTKGQWRLEATYGGKLVENCVQGVARDLLAYAMPRVEARGYEIVMHAHDELSTETDQARGSARELEEIMSELPEWAEGLPLKVGAWEGSHYRK